MTGVESANIASGLSVMARERPDSLAVLAPAGRDSSGRPKHVHWTFRQLDEMSDLVAAGLRQKGIGRSVRAVLMVKPGLSFFALTFGLFKAGAVPVLVDPGLGIKNLGPCLAEAQPEAFIGIPLAQVARRVLGWGKATIRTSTTINPGWPELWLDCYEMDGIAEDSSPLDSPSTPTKRPRSSSPAAAPASPRGRSIPTRSSRRRSNSSGGPTTSSPARSTSAPSPSSPCSARSWG